MKKERDKTEKYERLAAKDPEYYAFIGNLYADQGDFREAALYYRKAIDRGIPAYTALGDVLGYQSKYKKAFEAYRQGTDSGEAECFERVGLCYEKGYVKKDVPKAIEYYAKASELGSSKAARELGDLYYFEAPIAEPLADNFKNALKYYERAFLLGDIEIAKKIGFIYLNNDELKDVNKAIEWYEKGLSLGEESLNFDLAFVYLNDIHEYGKGLAYLEEGVKQNDPDCLVNVNVNLYILTGVKMYIIHSCFLSHQLMGQETVSARKIPWF